MKSQGKNIVYGKAVRPNAGIRAWYRAVLRALVDDMAEKTKKRILRVYYTKNPLAYLPKGLIFQMAPRVGLEPTTYRLTAGCSTIELSRRVR